MADKEISDEERTQAKDIFAKIRLYRREFEQKSKSVSCRKSSWKGKFAGKASKAQFLARIYSEKVGDKMKVTDEDVAHISHSIQNLIEGKKGKGAGILDRAKANGADFAALANEFTKIRETRDLMVRSGRPLQRVPKGRMVPAFEAAALALIRVRLLRISRN